MSLLISEQHTLSHSSLIFLTALPFSRLLIFRLRKSVSETKKTKKQNGKALERGERERSLNCLAKEVSFSNTPFTRLF